MTTVWALFSLSLFLFPSLFYCQSLPIPVTSCDLNFKSSKLPRIACSESCQPVVDTGKKRHIYLYNQTDEGSIRIADCRKLQITQKFTKTWTFSEIPGQKIVIPLKPSYSECSEAWQKQCRNGICGTEIPEISPEYHWASDTTKQIEYISIDSYQETFHVYQDEEPHILVHGNIVPVSSGFTISQDQYMITLWSPVTLEDNCPWTTGTLIQCIAKFGDTISMYCPTQGMTLDNIKVVKDKRCPDQKLYTTGHHIMFRDKLDSDDNVTLSRYLQLPVEPTQREWIMMDSINEALQTRDYLECMASCLNFNYESQKPQIFGTHLFLLSDNRSSIIPCNILPNCRVVLPIVSCIQPAMILVNCSGTVTWWNVTGDYTLRPTYCEHQNPTPASSVTIPTLNGPIYINASGVYTDNLAISESFVTGHLIDPTSFLSSQDPTILKISQTSVGINPTITSNITTAHPGIVDTVSAWYHHILRYLSHEVRVFLVSAIAVVTGTYIFIYGLKKIRLRGSRIGKRRRIRLVPSNLAPDEPKTTMIKMEYVMEDDEDI